MQDLPVATANSANSDVQTEQTEQKSRLALLNKNKMQNYLKYFALSLN